MITFTLRLRKENVPEKPRRNLVKVKARKLEGSAGILHRVTGDENADKESAWKQTTKNVHDLQDEFLPLKNEK